MTTLKTVTIAAVLLVGGASLAMAQNGPATGGQRPVAWRRLAWRLVWWCSRLWLWRVRLRSGAALRLLNSGC
jgi:hypothetical protein